MSLDYESLALIQQTAVKAAGVVHAHATGHVGQPLFFIPEGIEVKDAEPYAEGRYRFRGTFATQRFHDFITYIIQRDDPHGKPTSVFIATETGSAKAFFNLGTEDMPGHADDVATLTLTKTAAYAAMLHIVQRGSVSQKDMAEFLEDWFDCLNPLYPDSDTAIKASVTGAIAAIRDVTITKQSEVTSEERDLAASTSTFGMVEAKSKNRLPTGFMFFCSPYDGFEERTFKLRLAVNHVEGKPPQLALRIIGRGDVEEKIAQEFERRVHDELPGTLVYRGSFTP